LHTFWLFGYRSTAHISGSTHTAIKLPNIWVKTLANVAFWLEGKIDTSLTALVANGHKDALHKSIILMQNMFE
jgi:hypothetical protein